MILRSAASSTIDLRSWTWEEHWSFGYAAYFSTMRAPTNVWAIGWIPVSSFAHGIAFSSWLSF